MSPAVALCLTVAADTDFTPHSQPCTGLLDAVATSLVPSLLGCGGWDGALAQPAAREGWVMVQKHPAQFSTVFVELAGNYDVSMAG